ncbi:hypothetical protein PG990_008459 [Apiospora arundinis]
MVAPSECSTHLGKVGRHPAHGDTRETGQQLGRVRGLQLGGRVGGEGATRVPPQPVPHLPFRAHRLVATTGFLLMLLFDLQDGPDAVQDRVARLCVRRERSQRPLEVRHAHDPAARQALPDKENAVPGEDGGESVTRTLVDVDGVVGELVRDQLLVRDSGGGGGIAAVAALLAAGTRKEHGRHGPGGLVARVGRAVQDLVGVRHAVCDGGDNPGGGGADAEDRARGLGFEAGGAVYQGSRDGGISSDELRVAWTLRANPREADKSVNKRDRPFIL